MFYYAVLGIGVIVSFIFCYRRRLGFSVENLILKAVSSLCFLLTAVFALINNGQEVMYGSLIVMGGALGLVGDISLDLKGIYKQDEHIYLKGGFIFFLVGHIFYVLALVAKFKLAWYWILGAAVLSAIIGVVTVLSANLMKVHYGAYRKIVAFYVAFLAMTTVTSILIAIQSHFEKGYLLMAIGSVLFLLSDLVLSNTFFSRVKNYSRPFDYFINHFLYYAGQYLIAASVLFVK